jgi:hypothetical protein
MPSESPWPTEIVPLRHREILDVRTALLMLAGRLSDARPVDAREWSRDSYGIAPDLPSLRVPALVCAV